ncbi:hypothetical protein EB796_019946 [Bugula neritina]|uniref:Uncharacterized protein n=1 Tax=Bugula neritina TaxID=10212 RepID=A0A7J7J6E8_BUGNE|nr:hypothetical protein EB796_019946 [Bugula neritina]
MNVIGQAENLEYENCFYIALTHSPDSLVLDVTGGTGILFARREPGRRSQLWSHNVEGRLVHEGNRASKQLYKEKEAKYCLDIAELAVIAQGYSCCLCAKSIVEGRQRSCGNS